MRASQPHDLNWSRTNSAFALSCGEPTWLAADDRFCSQARSCAGSSCTSKRCSSASSRAPSALLKPNGTVPSSPGAAATPSAVSALVNRNTLPALAIRMTQPPPVPSTRSASPTSRKPKGGGSPYAPLPAPHPLPPGDIVEGGRRLRHRCDQLLARHGAHGGGRGRADRVPQGAVPEVRECAAGHRLGRH